MAHRASTVMLPGGAGLSVVDQGSRAGDALVLLPGPTDSWRSYEPVLAHLPPTLRTVAVSQRGHGESDKPAAGFGVADFAADVVPLLDALGIERAVLAGHSGSCPVVRRVALDHPGRVAGLVLEAAPTTLAGDPGLEGFVQSVVADLRDPIDPAFARSVVVDTSTDDLAPDVLDRLVAELLEVPARVWREMFGDLLRYDDTDELARIAAPTLLVWGDDDRLVGRAMQEELARTMPDATLLVYPGVGHTPRWEDPARFAADIAAFTAGCLSVGS